ncbi:hypothetical protein FB45DRAFT_1026222 [Roridomyces roridus]|uniref:SnoaL-like domain-containing protein n=1 Tax=Roridomyces roridus TaxID=1738132 RepID=A0AAD7C0A3_9AGAR|nr:hypothetical protein FB45DRAFT_1026222 [Roridomyces roridus]
MQIQPSLASTQQLEIAYAFLASCSTFDADVLADSLPAQFTHEVFPATIDVTAKRDKDKFLALLRLSGTFFERFEFVIPPLDIVQGPDVVTLHLKGNGTMQKTGKPYNNEYMLTFRFEGEKIVSVREFVDSKYTAENFPAPGV